MCELRAVVRVQAQVLVAGRVGQGVGLSRRFELAVRILWFPPLSVGRSLLASTQ